MSVISDGKLGKQLENFFNLRTGMTGFLEFIHFFSSLDENIARCPFHLRVTLIAIADYCN